MKASVKIQYAIAAKRESFNIQHSTLKIQHSTFNIIKDYEKEQFLGGGAAYCDSRTDSGTDRTGYHLV